MTRWLVLLAVTLTASAAQAATEAERQEAIRREILIQWRYFECLEGDPARAELCDPSNWLYPVRGDPPICTETGCRLPTLTVSAPTLGTAWLPAVSNTPRRSVNIRRNETPACVAPAITPRVIELDGHGHVVVPRKH